MAKTVFHQQRVATEKAASRFKFSPTVNGSVIES